MPYRVPAFLALILLSASSASAAFEIRFPPVAVVNQGTTGNAFDVMLVNNFDAPFGPQALDSFNLQIAISVGTGIQLTSVSPNTAAPYVFSGNSLGIVSIVSPNGAQLDWNDLAFLPPATINPGQSFGLGRVLYNVSPDTLPGYYPVTVNGITTFASFPGFTPIPFTTNGGVLAVTTPAPATGLAFTMGLASLRFLRRQRR